MAVSKEPNDTRFQKTLALHDWYLGADDWDYPLGGIQMLGKSDSEQIHGEAPRWAGAVTPDMPFEVLAHHAVDFWLCGEDLPQPGNRVTLEDDGQIRLTLDEGNNVAGLKRCGTSCSTCWAGSACTSTGCCPTASTCTRACRSAPRRTRRARCASAPTGVLGLDVDCKAHDLDNLYVVDTSFFPSIARSTRP